MTKSGTLGSSPAPRPAQPGEPTSAGAPAVGPPSGRAAGRPVSLWVLAAGGALAAGLYAALFEKMRFGPPLVMLALGGMTLALAGAALWRMIDPLSRAAADPAAARGGGRRPRELEREKQLVLKAIKEIELDYQMRKIAERDYREMIERYRARAIRLIGEIEAGDDYRTLIERELAIRLKLGVAAAGADSTKGPAKAATTEAGAPVTATPVDDGGRPVCAGCGAANDDDAKFCKKCGAKLA